MLPETKEELDAQFKVLKEAIAKVHDAKIAREIASRWLREKDVEFAEMAIKYFLSPLLAKDSLFRTEKQAVEESIHLMQELITYVKKGSAGRGLVPPLPLPWSQN